MLSRCMGNHRSGERQGLFRKREARVCLFLDLLFSLRCFPLFFFLASGGPFPSHNVARLHFNCNNAAVKTSVVLWYPVSLFFGF